MGLSVSEALRAGKLALALQSGPPAREDQLHYLIFRLSSDVDNHQLRLCFRGRLVSPQRLDDLFLEALLKLTYLLASETEFFGDLEFDFSHSSSSG